MPCELLPDCLNNIFEFLEDDERTLYSCLLVNRLWCKLSVRILWRKNIWDLRYNYTKSSKVLGTLISCLPNESKDLLYENKIFIPTPTTKTPLFDYVSFCKFISIDEINIMIENYQEMSDDDDDNDYGNDDDSDSDNDYNDSSSNSSNNNNNYNNNNNINNDNINNDYKKDLILIAQEIIKMFMKKIPSLKKLNYYLNPNGINHEILFIEFPGAKNCLKNLSELNCNSDIQSEFFYQMSKICHNIQSLTIKFGEKVSTGLNDLIISQKNLKSVSLKQSHHNLKDWTDIIPSLIKHSNTITKLLLKGENDRKPLTFIANFINLKELSITFDYLNATLEDFKDELRYFHFQKLQNLKFGFGCPRSDILMDFIKINGKNLNYLYINRYDNLLNISIPKLCPNLKFLYTIFIDKESLIDILNDCQLLECIQVMCGRLYIKEKDMLEAIVKYSPKCFHELRLYNYAKSNILSKDLDSFFINWRNRIPQKSITFICLNVFDDLEKRNVKIIEKYRKLGVIKNAKTYL